MYIHRYLIKKNKRSKKNLLEKIFSTSTCNFESELYVLKKQY